MTAGDSRKGQGKEEDKQQEEEEENGKDLDVRHDKKSSKLLEKLGPGVITGA